MQAIDQNLLETQIKVSSRRLGITDGRSQAQIIEDAVTERVNAVLDGRVDAEIAKRKRIEELIGKRTELQNNDKELSNEALAELARRDETRAKLDAINAELNDL